MENIYLYRNVGLPLMQCLGEVVAKRPKDPIEWIAHWLYRYIDNELYFYEKSIFLKQLYRMQLELAREDEKRQRNINTLNEEIRRVQISITENFKAMNNIVLSKAPPVERPPTPPEFSPPTRSIAQPLKMKKGLPRVAQSIHQTFQPQKQESNFFFYEPGKLSEAPVPLFLASEDTAQPTPSYWNVDSLKPPESVHKIQHKIQEDIYATPEVTINRKSGVYLPETPAKNSNESLPKPILDNPKILYDSVQSRTSVRNIESTPQQIFNEIKLSTSDRSSFFTKTSLQSTESDWQPQVTSNVGIVAREDPVLDRFIANKSGDDLGLIDNQELVTVKRTKDKTLSSKKTSKKRTSKQMAKPDKTDLEEEHVIYQQRYSEHVIESQASQPRFSVTLGESQENIIESQASQPRFSVSKVKSHASHIRFSDNIARASNSQWEDTPHYEEHYISDEDNSFYSRQVESERYLQNQIQSETGILSVGSEPRIEQQATSGPHLPIEEPEMPQPVVEKRRRKPLQPLEGKSSGFLHRMESTLNATQRPAEFSTPTTPVYLLQDPTDGRSSLDRASSRYLARSYGGSLTEDYLEEQSQQKVFKSGSATWTLDCNLGLICDHSILGKMRGRPAFVPPETPEWWESRGYSERTLYDPEIYSHPNNDVHPNWGKIDHLTYKDFVETGPYLQEGNLRGIHSSLQMVYRMEPINSPPSSHSSN